MKTYIGFIISSIITLHGVYASSGPIVIDFEEPSQYESCKLDKDYTSVSKTDPIEGRHSLRIDATSAYYDNFICFETPQGLLKGGKSYIAEFKAKGLAQNIEGESLFFEVKQDGDGAPLNRDFLDTIGEVKTYYLEFQTPVGQDNYKFRVIGRKMAAAIFDSLKIYESGFIPTSNGNKPLSGLRLPKGCPEFKVELPSATGGKEISADAFGMSPSNPDNNKALNDAIEQCKSEGATRLIVPKGVYRFTSDRPIRFEAFKNFTFDGQGSTFIFRKKINELFAVVGCEKMLIKGFNVDWDWAVDPIASFVQITHVDEKGAYADVKFLDYETFPKKDIRVATMGQVDPETMTIGREEGVFRSFKAFRTSPDPKTEWLSGNVLRIFSTEDTKSFFKPKIKDTIFQMKHYVYDMRGFWLKDNEHLTFTDINVYSCPGMVFYAEGQQRYWQLQNVNIIKPPGQKRAITCTADHLNCTQSLGYFKMENCEFSYGGDDCVNINDSTCIAFKAGKKTIRTRNLRHYVAPFVKPGDTIEFREDDFSPSGFKSKIISKELVSSMQEGIYEILFEDVVPEPKGKCFILFNKAYDSGNVIIRNCSFHDNQSRALLLPVSNVTVENNKFYHTRLEGIKFFPGYTYKKWSEGYGSTNVIIRGNSFDSVNVDGLTRDGLGSAIHIGVYAKHDISAEKTSYPIMQDFLIEKNKFENVLGATLYATSVKNLVFRDNVISALKPRQTPHSYRGSVYVSYASEMFISGNTWESSPLIPIPGILYNQNTTKDIYSWDNKLK